MVLTGKPFVFCVGADVDEFTRIASAEEAAAGSRAGHELFARIRALPVPDRGRGQRRLPRRRARARAPLRRAHARRERPPRRLPRGRALDHPRLGRHAARAEARRPGRGGAADRLEPAAPEPAARRRTRRSSSASPTGSSSRWSSWTTRCASPRSSSSSGGLERPEPDWSEAETILRKARARVEDAVHGATRAPCVALDLIEGARTWSVEEGYAAEEAAMGELLTSPQAQAAAYAFTVVERRSKKAGVPDAAPRRIQKVGIVGAGLMATQLATLFLRRLEVPVVLRDLEQSRVDEALATIREEVGATQPVPRHDRRRRHRLGAVRRLRPRARGGLRGARREARGLRRGAEGRARRDPRHEHVVAVGRGDGRRRRPALLQPGRRPPARRGRADADRRPTSSSRPRSTSSGSCASAACSSATRRRSSSTGC